MTKKELITIETERYDTLLRIKEANGGFENQALDYALKVSAEKLSAYGVQVEKITLPVDGRI